MPTIAILLDVLTLFAIMGLGGIGIAGVLAIKALSKKLDEWNPKITVKLPEHPNYERCYYCGERFPPDEAVKVGDYTYCKKHAVRR